MNKFILLLALLFIPQFSYAQTPTVTVTPTVTTTPTVTSTPTSTPTHTPAADANRHGFQTQQAFYSIENIILPTSVPTAFSTPQVLITQVVKMIRIVNDCDTSIVASLDGGSAQNFTILAKKDLVLPLAAIGFHQAGNIKIRGNAACTSGSVYTQLIY